MTDSVRSPSAFSDEPGSPRNGRELAGPAPTSIVAHVGAAINQSELIEATPDVEQLLDCLVNRRMPALSRILHAQAARKGLNESLALEALQEALSEALRRIYSGEAAATPNRWPLLIGFARWRLIDAARALLPTAPIDPAARTCLPHDPLEQSELAASLAQAFNELPSRLRPLAVYCYQQQHTYQEAAEHFGLKLGTISRWLHEAKQRLRASLLRQGIGQEFL